MTNEATQPRALPGTRSYVRFAVVGDARTGSTMVVHGLNDHPEIVCFREVFNFLQEFVDYWVEGRDPNVASELELRQNDPAGFLKECVFNEHPAGTKAVGFKILYKHVVGNRAVLPLLVGDNDLKIIHIKRRNLLRVMISTKIAQHTGRWVELDHRPQPLPVPTVADLLDALTHPRRAWRKANEGYRRWRPVPAETGPYARTDPAARGVPFHLTAEECDAFFARALADQQEWDDQFRAHDRIVVYYEDFLDDKTREFAKLQSFLGVAPAKVFADTRQQNAEPLRQLIANYDELFATYRGTPYELYFD